VARRIDVNQWVVSVVQCKGPDQRDRLIGVSCTLAAKLLIVSRSRIHQLIKTDKLTVIDVYDGAIRIGHLVTLASIDRRRRTVKQRRTQWRAMPKVTCTGPDSI
jgi:hypothetical protein